MKQQLINIDEELTTYLIDISNESLSVSEKWSVGKCLTLSVTWAYWWPKAKCKPSGQHIHNKGIEFSDTAKAELVDVYNCTLPIAPDSIRVVVDDDKVLLQVKSSFAMKSWKTWKQL